MLNHLFMEMLYATLEPQSPDLVGRTVELQKWGSKASLRSSLPADRSAGPMNNGQFLHASHCSGRGS